MTYTSWVQAHGEKHRAIMKKLTHLSDDEVITYFRFENMVQNEPDFCALYKAPKKCHDIKVLNCYLCACPHFRFKDEGLQKVEDKTLFSLCDIQAKKGKQFISEHAIHQDCSGCTIPHHEAYIKKVFSRDWFEIIVKD